MKKYVSLLVTTLILASGIITGCSKSADKVLVDSLDKTKVVNSVEINLTSSSKSNGQTFETKMNMKTEDLKENIKTKVEVEKSGQKQEFYLVKSNNDIKMYAKDMSGKYNASSLDSSQVYGMDAEKSFNAYIEVIKNNPDMIKKTGDNTYELNVPKEKADGIYSKVAGKNAPQSLDSFKVEFAIGDDEYIKSVNIKLTSGSIEAESKSEYSNFNKEFDIVIPEVSK